MEKGEAGDSFSRQGGKEGKGAAAFTSLSTKKEK